MNTREFDAMAEGLGLKKGDNIVVFSFYRAPKGVKLTYVEHDQDVLRCKETTFLISTIQDLDRYNDKMYGGQEENKK